MNALIKEIQTSLLELIGSGIKSLPGLILAAIVLLLTRRFANQLRRIIAKALVRVVSSQSLRSLIVNIGYVMIWIVGILAAAVIAFPSLRLGDILALFGLGSVTIGLVFQDICKNFIAGALLLLQEPFQLQDQVLVEGFEGTIEEIDFLNTQILTYQGERVLLPNSMLLTKPVKILTALPHRRTDLTLKVDYSTPLSDTLQILLNCLIEVEGVLSEPAPKVDIVTFGDSSIDVVLRYWTLPQQSNLLEVQTKVLIAIQQLCEKTNIIIPYPTNVIYIYNQLDFDGRTPKI